MHSLGGERFEEEQLTQLGGAERRVRSWGLTEKRLLMGKQGMARGVEDRRLIAVIMSMLLNPFLTFTHEPANTWTRRAPQEDRHRGRRGRRCKVECCQAANSTAMALACHGSSNWRRMSVWVGDTSGRGPRTGKRVVSTGGHASCLSRWCRRVRSSSRACPPDGGQHLYAEDCTDTSHLPNPAEATRAKDSLLFHIGAAA
jgi:hypothetical protein